MKDFYYILGINRNSAISDIKAAYRKLSKKFHPDMNSGDKYFEERFKEIQEAYEILSDVSKRTLYDIKLNNYSTKYYKKNQLLLLVQALLFSCC